MKKIYTLLAATFVAFGATAQTYDLGVSWVALSSGGTYDTNPIDLSFTITNNGTEAIAAETDTLYVAYTIDNGSGPTLAQLNLDGGINLVTLAEELAPGESINVGTSWNFASNTNFEICATIYGIGSASFPDHAGDSDDSDNAVCATVDVEDGFDVSVEELEKSIGKVYVSGEELVLENESISSAKPANLTIVNMAGQTMYRESFQINTGTNTFPIGNLNRGIYIVALEVEGNTITRKISIQ